MTTVVPDTSTLVFGLLWRGLPRRLVTGAIDGLWRLISADALFQELDTVLRRPKFAKRLSERGTTADQLMVSKVGTRQEVQEVTIQRPKRAKLTAEESLRRMEAFPERKEEIVAAVRKSKGRALPS